MLFKFLFSHYILFTLHPDCSPFFQSHPHKSLQSLLPFLLIREGRQPLPPWVPTSLNNQLEAVHPVPLKLIQAVQLREGNPKAGNRIRDNSCSYFQVPACTLSCTPATCVRDQFPTSASSLVGYSISVSPHVPQIVDYVN